MRDDGRTVEIGYDELLHDTGLAIKVRIDGDDVWIPWSQISDHDPDGQAFEVSAWFARKNGLD